jgi:hypothetical protein
LLARVFGLWTATALGLLAAAGPAGAAIEFGDTFAPSPGCANDAVFIQSASPGGQYAAPEQGVITSWSHRAAAGSPQLKLKVARPAGGDNFTIVGETGFQTMAPNALNTFPARIPVQAGDVIGFYLLTGGSCFRNANADFVMSGVITPDPQPGATLELFPNPGVQLDVQAVLEPDCDADGLGDESQDSLVDCEPPETTITAGPKDKTKKRTATFQFVASEPASGYECSLDAAGFTPCGSPHEIRVKKGMHRFEVRATDTAGNVDGSPASDDWKVKRKKSKK